MNIALSQLNFRINDFELNREKICTDIRKAKEKQVDLIVFSELSVCGYPPLDLLDYQDFTEKCISSIKEIAKECDTIAAIVGAPAINQNEKGKALYNSAYFLYEKEIKSIHHKTLLPTYDVFDEYRYFEQNDKFNVVSFKGKKIAITICEDLWEDQPTSSKSGRGKLYTLSPMSELIKQDPDFVINIAASPFSYDSESNREHVFINNVKRFNLPVFYVNQVGGNTDLIFDGGSMVVSETGEIITKLKSFEEDFRIFHLSKLHDHSEKMEKMEKTGKIYNALILGIRDYFQKNGFKTAVIGLSGGIDSALTAALAVDALGNENIVGILMPSEFSSKHSISDAKALAKNLKIKSETIPIHDLFSSFTKSLSPLFKDLPFGLTEENIQARIRGSLLMAYSNKFGHLVLNTSNKSEAAVGYGTLYGDMNGSISVLGDVYKTDVFQLAKYMNRNQEIIPINSISKPPSAELRPNQKDSDSLPDYEILDNILFNYIEKQESKQDILNLGFEKQLVEKTINMVNRNEYKRYQTAPILRVSSKAFGIGRRMPLVAKY